MRICGLKIRGKGEAAHAGGFASYSVSICVLINTPPRENGDL